MEWYLYFIIILCCIIIPMRTGLMYRRILRKRKGVKRTMPKEMLKEFIGKNCTVTLFSGWGGVQGVIIAVEDNWIKVEEKKKIRIINGEMIQDIVIAK